MKVLRNTCVIALVASAWGLAACAASDKPEPGTSRLAVGASPNTSDLASADAAVRGKAAHRIAMTGVYAKPDIDLLVGYLGDNTRLMPSDANTLSAPGAYGRDQQETSPSEQARRALVRIGKPAVPSLLAALKEGRYGHADSQVTFKAARVLGELGEPSALPRLKQLASAGEYGHANESGADDEFPLAIAKIAKTSEYEFLHGLLARAEREKRVNSGLLEAIGFSEDERAVPVLEEYLKSGDRYRKMEVIRALGHTRSPKAVALLLPYASSDDWHLRKYSGDALTELGHSDLIPKGGQ